VLFDNPTEDEQVFLIDGDGPFVVPPGPLVQRRLRVGTLRFTLLSSTDDRHAWTGRVRWNTNEVATLGRPGCYVNVGYTDDSIPVGPRRWTRLPHTESLHRTPCPETPW